MIANSEIEKVVIKPPASALIQSLRSIGYSFNSAVADIVDNSIAAKATKVEIIVDFNEKGFHVSISDNGDGMTRKELIDAMSLGSKNPLEQRRIDDLGRFGMGLKTASFSQAKILSCITSKNGVCLGAEWDLDKVIDDWSIQLFDSGQCKELFPEYHKPNYDGTTIIWKNCDRVIENLENPEMIEHRVGNLILDLREHLALIFHKFIDSKKGFPVDILLNGSRIQGKDPFCRSTKNKSSIASTLLLDEKLNLDQGSIEVKGYTLPHPSKIKSKALQRKISIDGDYFNGQGFYVYRANRLLAWGSWFRILPKNESNKLGRVELNIPNTMDELWRLDIKKSTVELPTEIRAQIKEKIKVLGVKSRKTFTRRSKLKNPGSSPIWLRCIANEGKSISYKVDRSNELVKKIKGKSNSDPKVIEALLSLIEIGLPLRLIENDLASDFNLGRFEGEEISEEIKLQVDSLLELGISKDSIINHMARDDSASIGAIDSLVRYLEKIKGA